MLSGCDTVATLHEGYEEIKYNIPADELYDITWKYHGYSPKEASEWINAGFSSGGASHIVTMQYIPQWKANGFSPSEAGKWVNIVGISNASKANLWRSSGYSPSKAYQYKPWIDANFSPLETQLWIKDGFQTPADPKILKSEGFNPKSGKKMKKWMDAGFDPLRARELQQEGSSLNAAIKMKPWVIAGIDPKSAKQWQKSKVNLSGALFLSHFGVSPEFYRTKLKQCNGNFSNLAQFSLNNDPYAFKGKCFYVESGMLKAIQYLGRNKILVNFSSPYMYSSPPFPFYVYSKKQIPISNGYIDGGVFVGTSVLKYKNTIGALTIAPSLIYLQ